jgi:hypothetical protein
VIEAQRGREHEQIAARPIQRRQQRVEDLRPFELRVLGHDHAPERQAAHPRRLVARQEQHARVLARLHRRHLKG